MQSKLIQSELMQTKAMQSKSMKNMTKQRKLMHSSNKPKQS